MPSFYWPYTLLLIAALLGGVLGLVAYLILAERKVSAWMQDRLGPNRVGPGGLLQPIADGGKMFLKEDVIPGHVDRLFFLLAPAAAMGTALLAIAVVPFGPTVGPPGPIDPATPNAVAAFEQQQAAYAAESSFVIVPGLDVGILYVFAVGSLAVYGIVLGGWSANNKYSLLGSLRSTAQVISYEIPLGLSVLGVVLTVGSLNLESIVDYQAEHGWFVLWQPLAFLLFMTSVYAECNRLPFDLPEAEQELVGGYHTEYSSLKFGMFFLGEYAHMVTTSFLLAVVFWGGWHLPGVSVMPGVLGGLIKLGIIMAKMGVFIALYLLVRWTVPRFRFDQLMMLAWKVMIPLATVNFLAVILVLQLGWWPVTMTVISAALFVAAGYLSLRAGTSVTAPRRHVRAMPPGLPAEVTYAAR